ncbi:hypothetical protein HPB51_014420 [Rhipicephalus microplus]|uniref:Uncharacterized protein n=1 Tax=Rhipicephalus microplus TaxID=6941 RepID=A0A9J6F589_RHIMP|nr:hypothetical protein HPB51_014420 [Rhipicephalus microplus]
MVGCIVNPAHLDFGCRHLHVLRYQRRIRLLRIGVFMLMATGFLYQASKVVKAYLSFPSAVDVRIEGAEVLLFPGLSVCVTNCVTRQSYSRLPSQMCYTMNWRHDPKIETVHQNVLAFEMNVLFAWPEDDVIELDEFEMNLGFHHVDTNTAGKKHAMAFKPSGDFVFGIVQGTQVLGLVGGYSGFWMGVAIVVGATESVRVVFDFCRRRVRGRLRKAEITFLFRVVKMLMVQGCFVACSFSVYWDYENYRHFYTAVTYEQENMRGVFFPAVTICSYEAVNFTRMCTEYGRYNKCIAATFDTTVGNDIVAMKYVINYTYPPADVFSNCTMTFSGEICESFKCDNL